MGKKDSAHRTKGNTKPSSSARSAQLLSEGGPASSGFIGFGGVSAVGSLGVLSAPTGKEDPTEDLVSSLPGELRMSLTKMSKRDVTTKIKALQEFESQVSSLDPTTVKSLLPFWPRVYAKIGTDHDRRVREAAQKANLAVVHLSGRNLAPHLRALAPTWFLSLCDPHPPAASAAARALEVAFPGGEEKRAGAARFCRREIAAAVEENIVRQTKETMSDPKITSPEDMESKHLRVVSGSLESWALYLKMTSGMAASEEKKKGGSEVEEKEDPALASQRTVLESGTFWKLAQHKSGSIRSSWLSLCRQLAVSFSTPGDLPSDLESAVLPKLCARAFAALDDKDAVAAKRAWEAALTMAETCKTWHEHVNVEKSLLPRLLSHLRKSEPSQTSELYPNLLPLLSRLPRSATVSDKKAGSFPRDWLRAVREGLLLQQRQQQQGARVLPSHAGRRRGLEALLECALFLLVAAEEEGTLEHARQGIVEEINFLLAAAALPEEKNQADDESDAEDNGVLSLSKTERDFVLAQLASLLRSLSKRPQTKPVFDDLWALLRARTGSSSEAAFEMLLAIKKGGDRSPKKKKRGVAFVEEKGAIQEEEAPERTPFDEKVEALSVELVSKCLSGSEEEPGRGLELARRLLKERVAVNGSDCFLSNLNSSLGITTPSTSSSPALTFLLGYVLPRCNNGDNNNMGDLCQLGAAVARSLKDSEAFLTQAAGSLDDCWLSGLLGAACEMQVGGVREWVAGEQLGGRLGAAAENVSEEGSRKLLEVAFKTGFVLHDASLSSVLGAFAEALSNGEDKASSSSSRICDLLLALKENRLCWRSEAGRRLLEVLFKKECQRCKDPSFNEALGSQIRSCWLSGAAWLDHIEEGSFWSEAAGSLRAAALASSEYAEAASLSEVARSLLDLRREEVSSCFKRQQEVARLVLPTAEEWQEAEDGSEARLGRLEWERMMLRSSGTEGSSSSGAPHPRFLLFSPPPSSKEEEEDEESLSLLCLSVYFGPLIDHISRWKNEEEEDDDTLQRQDDDEDTGANYTEVFEKKKPTKTTSSESKEPSLEFSEVDQLLGELVHYLRAASLARHAPALLGGPEPASRLLLDPSERLLRGCSLQVRRSLLSRVLDLSVRRGRGWTVTLFDLLSALDDSVEVKAKLERMVPSLDEWSEGKAQTTQALMAFADATLASSVVFSEVGRLLSSEAEGAAPTQRDASHLAVIGSGLRRLREVSQAAPIDLDASLTSVLKWIETKRQASEECFLYGCGELTDASWERVSFASTVCELFTCLLRLPSPPTLTSEHWDMILCSLLSWVQSLEESLLSSDEKKKMNEITPEVASFICAVADLTSAVGALFASLGPDFEFRIPASTSEEWREFFCSGIFPPLLSLFVQQSECAAVASRLGAALDFLPEEQLLAHSLPPKFLLEDVDSDGNFPDNLLYLMNHLAPMVGAEGLERQAAATKILMRVMDHLVASEEKRASFDEEARELPRRISEIFDLTRPVVTALFQEFEFGEPVPLPSGNAAFSCVSSYLRAWLLTLRLVSGASMELRPKYSETLRRSEALEALVPALFHLLPQRKVEAVGAAGSEEEQLRDLAALVWKGLLKQLPAMVRSWWNGCEKRAAETVERYTAQFVTLWADEVRNINESNKNTTFDNMTIRVRPSVREVVANYTLDDSSMELVISLPANFPLGPVKVETGKKVGVGNSQWRNWMLQLTTFLQHQNGTILDGLIVWKRNVDKRFEGVEECYICFYVLHGANHQLPKLACRTCKKKFHSACLYKWFSTSNNSTCPLCRNLF